MLQILRMGEGGMVENEVIGYCRAYKVNNDSEYPTMKGQYSNRQADQGKVTT